MRAQLKGPAMVQYYPPRMPKISALNKLIPELGAVDFLEEQRYVGLDCLQMQRLALSCC